MHITRTERLAYGPLNCIQVDAGHQPTVLLMLCHGYGAPGDDLFPVAVELLEQLPDGDYGLRCILPAAPLSPAEFRPFGGRAWWPLDLERMLVQLASGNLAGLTEHEPAGLKDAREALSACLSAAIAGLANPEARIVLGGFSQGAMVSVDLALRGTIAVPAALLLYSGSLLCASQWLAAAPRLAGRPVVQSHGRSDEILPFEAGKQLAAILERGGAQLQFISFANGHTIPYEAIGPSVELLRQQLNETRFDPGD
jgi:phospholipase/carboxylesterase